MTGRATTGLDPAPAAPAGAARGPARFWPARSRLGERAARPPLVLLVPALVAAGVAVLPLVYLAVRATEDGFGAVVDVLARERTARLVARSLGLAAAVTAASAVIGVGLAWLVTRCRLPGRRAWAALAALPLAIPSYVAAFSW